jgi:peptide/nickel transport system permease protein
MLALLAQRIAFGILTLLAASVLVFAATEVLPGDVASAILGQEATEEAKAVIREQLRLDRPVVERYAEWLARYVQGDLGSSLASRRPVADLVGLRLANTLLLTAVTAALAVPLAIALGLMSALYPDGAVDRLISLVSLMLIAVPDYLIAGLLVLVFAVTWQLLPAISYLPPDASLAQTGRALVLPVLTLTTAMLAHMIRMTRAAMLDVLRAPYVEMALLKGASRGRIVLVHALPNAIGPIANVVALNLGYLITGVAVVETVFTYPGLGRLMVDSVASRDLTTVQAIAMLFSAAYVGLNLLADLVTIAGTPRLRYPR